MQNKPPKTAANQNCYWITCACLAGATQGTGAFIYASNYAKYGFIANGLLGPGVLLSALVAKLILETTYYCRHKSWFNPENSAWKTAEGKWYFKNLIAVVSNAVTNFLYTVVMTFAWRFARMGGLNQGIISTLLSFASVFNLFLFRFFFAEKVNLPQLLGIFLMIASVCCMSINLNHEEVEGTDPKYIYFALATGMIAPVFMSTKHVIIRKFKGSYGAISQSIDGFILEYLMFSVITVLLLTTDDDEYEFRWMDMLVATGAGLLMCLGRTFIAIAVQKGTAAPA